MPDDPLRVAMLMRSASRLNTGVFDAARGLAQALVRQSNLRVEVFAIEDEYTNHDRPLWGDIPVHTYPMIPPAAFGYSPVLARGVAAFAPDIVHLHGLWTYPSLVARRLALKANARVIISAHGMMTPWALKHKAFKKKVAMRLYERNNLQNAACIHATSEDEVRQIRAYGVHQSIAAIPLGMNCAPRARTDDRSGVGTVLALGRLHPVKGVDRLLLAWGRIAANHENWRLRIIGPSERNYRERLMRIRDEARCTNVEFEGYLTADAKERALLSADIFVLPSLSESFGLTVLEALAHGIPVIVSTAAPWRNVVTQRCGWWVEPEVERLAVALDEAMRLSLSELKQMGNRGRGWVEREFSWDSAAAKMCPVYAWLAGRGEKPDCVTM